MLDHFRSLLLFCSSLLSSSPSHHPRQPKHSLPQTWTSCSASNFTSFPQTTRAPICSPIPLPIVCPIHRGLKATASLFFSHCSKQVSSWCPCAPLQTQSCRDWHVHSPPLPSYTLLTSWGPWWPATLFFLRTTQYSVQWTLNWPGF